MDKLAVVVKNLHKEFILPQHKHTSVKQAFVNIGKKNIKKHQKVLDGISFDVEKGDFFGIVGRNGSGKSTLLKILAGVYSPTSGDVNIGGELTPFIELGVGFNPELSGRDNVFLNGALLGFSRSEMSKMYDEIVQFAELEPFMDQKLKNYSSGMQVRLAFSIAIKAKNDILIFDEVLAVGDEAFQRKCLDMFEQYKAEKQTVILVTHDMDTVRKFCNRAMLLSDGKIVEIGNPRIVADKYSQLNQASINKEIAQRNKSHATDGLLKATIKDSKSNIASSFAFGDKAIVEVSWNGIKSSQFESIGISIFKQSGEHVTGINSRFGHLGDSWKQKGQISLEFKLDIVPGTYHFLVEMFEKPGKVLESINQGLQFSISSSDVKWSGLIELPHDWHQKSSSENDD